MVSKLLLEMTMTEQEGGLSSLELRLQNLASYSNNKASLAFEDDRSLKLGAVITIYSGDATEPQEIFRGKITGLEIEFLQKGAPELVVLAEDQLQPARMARRTQLYTNTTVASIARQIASRLSLTPVITGFNAPIGTQVQLDESDLAFLRRILARYDGDLQVVTNELHVSPRSDVRRNALELKINSQLRRARILADLAHQVTAVTISGWDAVQGKRITAHSRGAHGGTGSGQTGAQILQRQFGDRAHHIAHLAVTTDQEAQAVADAAFDQRARRFVCVEGTTEGNPALRVGSHVNLNLTGLGDRFSNTYYVTRACHRFDPLRGYETDFEAECGYWQGGS